MTKSKKVLDFFFSWVAGLSGLVGAIFSFANGLLGYFDFHIDKPFVILIGLLGLLLMSSGYERWTQREEIENKLSKLTADFDKLRIDFLQIPSFEIVKEEKNITDETN